LIAGRVLNIPKTSLTGEFVSFMKITLQILSNAIKIPMLKD